VTVSCPIQKGVFGGSKGGGEGDRKINDIRLHGVVVVVGEVDEERH